jgi:hypothetical protein
VWPRCAAQLPVLPVLWNVPKGVMRQHTQQWLPQVTWLFPLISVLAVTTPRFVNTWQPPLPAGLATLLQPPAAGILCCSNSSSNAQYGVRPSSSGRAHHIGNLCGLIAGVPLLPALIAGVDSISCMVSNGGKVAELRVVALTDGRASGTVFYNWQQ